MKLKNSAYTFAADLSDLALEAKTKFRAEQASEYTVYQGYKTITIDKLPLVGRLVFTATQNDQIVPGPYIEELFNLWGLNIPEGFSTSDTEFSLPVESQLTLKGADSPFIKIQ